MPATFNRSKELFARAQKSIAGGINSGIRKLEQPVPIYFAKGSGPRIWDVDGNETIDYQLGQGALLYGHAPAGLADAISAQAKLGIHWAAQCELEIEVAERIQSMVPSVELVRFNNCATEAVMAAFRLARATTGRSKILRFEGHYHGWGDEGLVGFANPPATWTDDDELPRTHPSKGIIPEVTEHFILSKWNDAAHLQRMVDAHKGEIAAIIFEPALCNTCCIEPVAGFLQKVRELCDRDGMLMISDETITGFRFGASCAQGFYGYKPDLSIFGKAIGGGTPFAALGGTKAAMAKIISGESIHAGTLNANPLCLAASKWCLDEIIKRGDTHPAGTIALGKRLMAGLAKIAAKNNIPMRPQGPGLAFHTVILKPGAAEGVVLNYRDYVTRHDAPRWGHIRMMLLEEGVRAIERGLWSISTTHTDKDIDDTLARAEIAFARHAAEWKPAA